VSIRAWPQKDFTEPKKWGAPAREFFAVFVFSLGGNVRILDNARAIEQHPGSEPGETLAARTKNPAMFTLAQRLLFGRQRFAKSNQ
jgi:hypothetical protein